MWTLHRDVLYGEGMYASSRTLPCRFTDCNKEANGVAGEEEGVVETYVGRDS